MSYKLLLIFGWIHHYRCKLVKSSFHVDLKEPTIKKLKDFEQPIITDEYWLEQFLYILFNYSTLLVPILVIVYLVKNNFCCLPVQRSKFIQIFVHGKLAITNNSELEEQLIDNYNDSSEKSLENSQEIVKSKWKVLIILFYCFIGLQISYLTWGVIQEKIMTTSYSLHSTNLSSQDTIRFKDSQFLVLINRVLAFAFASVTLVASNLRERLMNQSYYVPKSKRKYLIAPLNEFVYCSLSNILSSWCQYEALKYVNFPTQILSKACKLLAVMLMSQLINKKRYKRIEYMFALSITLGMSLFLFGNQQLQDNYTRKLHHQTNQHSFIDGIFILMLYVTFDAFTSNWQGKLFDKYGISSLQMMAVINFYSIAFTLASLTETGSLVESLKLILNCKELFKDCLLLSICSATGQLFVFYTISQFGPLAFTTIMTLRQALAILLSCFIYKHHLSILSVVGICLVFATLFYQIYYKTSNRPTKTKR